MSKKEESPTPELEQVASLLALHLSLTLLLLQVLSPLLPRAGLAQSRQLALDLLPQLQADWLLPRLLQVLLQPLSPLLPPLPTRLLLPLTLQFSQREPLLKELRDLVTLED